MWGRNLPPRFGIFLTIVQAFASFHQGRELGERRSPASLVVGGDPGHNTQLPMPTDPAARWGPEAPLGSSRGEAVPVRAAGRGFATGELARFNRLKRAWST